MFLLLFEMGPYFFLLVIAIEFGKYVQREEDLAGSTKEWSEAS
jgi:hypothetical protein